MLQINTSELNNYTTISLYEASLRGYIDIVRFFIIHEADIDKVELGIDASNEQRLENNNDNNENQSQNNTRLTDRLINDRGSDSQNLQSNSY